MNRIWLWVLWQEWRADCRRKRKQRDFDAGYQYAKECFRSNMDRPLAHLHNLVETARVFNDYSEFDNGIEEFMDEVDPHLDYLREFEQN